MDLVAGRVRNLLNRDGRYFARLVIPKELRPHMEGRTELRTALGPDYRTALKALPGAVAALQHQIALGERRAVDAGERSITIGRYPLSPPQIAIRDYHAQLTFDEDIRANHHQYASFDVGYDEGQPFRNGYSGKLSDDQLEILVVAHTSRGGITWPTGLKRKTPKSINGYATTNKRVRQVRHFTCNCWRSEPGGVKARVTSASISLSICSPKRRSINDASPMAIWQRQATWNGAKPDIA